MLKILLRCSFLFLAICNASIMAAPTHQFCSDDDLEDSVQKRYTAKEEENLPNF